MLNDEEKDFVLNCIHGGSKLDDVVMAVAVARLLEKEPAEVFSCVDEVRKGVQEAWRNS